MSPTYKSLFFSSSCRYGNRKSHLFTVISALHSLVFIICNPERFQHCPYTHRRKQCWEPRPALAAVARPVCPQRCARPGGRDPPGQGPSQQVACPPSDELCFPAGREGVSWVVSSRQWGTPPSVDTGSFRPRAVTASPRSVGKARYCPAVADHPSQLHQAAPAVSAWIFLKNPLTVSRS